MPAASFLSRVLRLQFSLRALLLLMAIVGSGIAIFRWPWVETTEEKLTLGAVQFGETFEYADSIGKDQDRWQHVRVPILWGFVVPDSDDYRVTTTFHRSWNGTPQRNGLQQHWRVRDKDQLIAQRHYIDDELRRLVHFGDEGEVIRSEDWEQGLPHGKFVERSRGRIEEGNQDRAKRTGTWQTNYEVTGSEDEERVTLLHSYRDGVLHGDWIWKTPAGRVLQSVKYDDGKLIEWNGLPPQQHLAKLLQQCQLKDGVLEQVQQPATSLTFAKRVIASQLLAWDLQLGGRPTGLSLYASRDKVPFTLSFFDIEAPRAAPPLEAIVEFSLTHNVTLMVRSGRLFLVPISATELDHGANGEP
jgi:hypothetical protein